MRRAAAIIAVVMMLLGCASRPTGTIYKVSSEPPRQGLASIALSEVKRLHPEGDFQAAGSPGSYEKMNPWTGRGEETLSFSVVELKDGGVRQIYLVTFVSRNDGPWELLGVRAGVAAGEDAAGR